MKKPILSAIDAVNQIRDGQTVAIEGSGGGIVEPCALLMALRDRFLATASPRDLCLVHSTGMGDRDARGMSVIALEGMIRCVIGGHFNQSPAIARMAEENKIQAYNLPIGVICQLYREIAARRPGLISHIGLGTFIDPRQEGAKLNSVTREDLVSLIRIDGQEYLFFRSFPINVAIIRASIADEEGYLSMESEPAKLSVLAMAQAAHNSGGIVIAQVKHVTSTGSIEPHRVSVPGTLVDYLVVDATQAQTYDAEYNPAFNGAVRRVQNANHRVPFSVRKIVARRAALELQPDAVINLGVGISDLVAGIAGEEGISDRFTLTVEQGSYGGVPSSGILFGASINPKAIIDTPSQFDYYDGGGIDRAFLGMAQVDKAGNVNVSKYNRKIIGTGGFVDISQGSKAIVFCSTFTTGGLEIQVGDGKIKIIREGRYRKFVNRVDQITYSGSHGCKKGQQVLYVTERAVFRLMDYTLCLEEIAQGIDLQKDVLDQMDFSPLIAPTLKPMDARIFCEPLMGLHRDPQYVKGVYR